VKAEEYFRFFRIDNKDESLKLKIKYDIAFNKITVFTNIDMLTLKNYDTKKFIRINYLEKYLYWDVFYHTYPPYVNNELIENPRIKR
ncbi:MAG TPA: hypothetical protein VKR58_02160, partial [Aquella sp.]|nr:hypothetical protein [Aquella sp.]